tara:strand:- start:188 stop:553 length:366 start_codon:yes stop_codon:yes gene_type:complete
MAEINKKQYIFDHIDEIENHTKIVNFLIFNNIKHTSNNNGYFVNISKLDDDLIHKLYDLIVDLNENINDSVEQEIYENIKIINENDNKKKVSEIKHKDIKLSTFSSTDKELIQKSKNYKFE